MKNGKINKKKKSALKDRVVGAWRDKSFLQHKFFYLTLAAVIFAIAILARTYHITSLPPGIYPDEAVNGTDAINANETGHYQLFYPNNYGREGLFMNLIALGFKIFGVSVITLKMWSVFFGVLTVAGMMLLARELFGTYRAGLVAGFLYATSFWAINFNRISFRANMLPFVLVFTFYFLFKGLREKIYPAPISINRKDARKNSIFFPGLKNWCGEYIDFILAGVFFGLGMHGYIAFRVAPAILVALFIAFLISKKRFLREYWKPIMVFFFSAFLVALPMLLTFYFHPEYFETRSESVSVLSPKVNQGHLARALWESATKTFGMFNFTGDQNWRHNFPSQPELQSWTGVFFLIGIAVLLYYFFFRLYQRIRQGKRSDDFVISVLLLSWLFAMLLPGLLTYEGLPHALRTIGALPVAILIAAFAVEILFRFLDRLRPQGSNIFSQIFRVVLVVLVIWSGSVAVKTYFIDWASASQIHPAFAQNFKNMALYLNNLPPNVNKYVIANAGGQIMDDGLPVSAEVVKLLTRYRTPGIVYTRPADFDPRVVKAPAKVVLMYYDGEIIAKIKSTFPNVYVQKLDPQPGNGTDYYVINVN
ncbi:MAG: glycosyltransferase family 39 protein [Patescibacteria group bacterium]|nr:glycosyltransferase family 39 protein [Patescibacteria group bacterium]